MQVNATTRDLEGELGDLSAKIKKLMFVQEVINCNNKLTVLLGS